MNFERNYKELIKTIGEYDSRLNKYSEEQFQQKPSNGGWSLAQVYAHLITANQLSVRGMGKIIEGKISESEERINWKAWLILFMGKIPAGRKVPKVVEERTPLFENTAYARAQIHQFINDIGKVFEQRHKLGKKHKIKHPSLGLLNASEWIRFMEVHSKHHLRQIERTEEMIGIK